MKYDPHAHHRRSIRLPTFDYSEHGAYFVTICTSGRECILENEPYRALLAKAWSSIIGGSVSQEDGYFVVMPNHIHGVVFIEAAATGTRHQTASLDRAG
ncbi:MAG: hypothetical protein ACRDFT_09225 [bacterium]